MYSLPMPVVNDGVVYDNIASAKHPPRQQILQGIRAPVMAACQNYSQLAPDVHLIGSLATSAAEKDALKHAYDVPTKPMNKLRNVLNQTIRSARCAMCGVGEATTLDHYLPKDDFPEFSVYSNNLTPSCAACNTKKKKKIVDQNTQVRSFLHPYFDIVPNFQFLGVEIRIDPTSFIVQFQINRVAGMPAHVYNHLRSHVDELGLLDRYRKSTLNHLSDDRRAYARTFNEDGTGAILAAQLANRANDYALDYGPNYWLAVLYTELSSHNGFCHGGFQTLDAIQ
jgi:hypothetical protein